MTINDICKQADSNKDNLPKLNELWGFLKANRMRFTQVEFEYAAEHIGEYVEDIEDSQEAKELLRKIDNV